MDEEYKKWLEIRKPDEPDFVGAKSNDPNDHPNTPVITDCYICGKSIKGEWFGFGTGWIVDDTTCENCQVDMIEDFERQRYD